MRDSIGGTILFWIVLALFSVFIIFIAFIIKYARVYKIKNTMISYIEKNEGISTQIEFETTLKINGYSDGGQYKVCRYLLPNKGGYYTLELYSVTSFPVLGNFTAITIRIKGETNVIKTGTLIRNTEIGGGWFAGTVNECKLCKVDYSGLGNCETTVVE